MTPAPNAQPFERLEWRVVLDETADYDAFQAGPVYLRRATLDLDLPSLTQDRPYHIQVRAVSEWLDYEQVQVGT